ncbi:NAD-dependent succinate-semialdehyde dehydrogenase [Cytophagales bacterium LB-30]|uniref:NAD-dependent succinate-semialdehyde dehydrogenase n=1 Tax=Shiella aurantiaca TaxID=3058365 RepID=A0ABT8F487_9BACT|nr:NAD-dependent succinate-semialdehyde dehydrogenase [Shiella aurantiaca]MDN4165215.1 NAD-dependent succinate-semialdehyde dehydrogenase [Shiella aurantiaca]
MPIQSKNPYTGEVLTTYSEASSQLVENAIEKAHFTFQTWKAKPLEYRVNLLLRLAEVLEKDTEALARLMALEMGKVLADGRAEIEKCAACCRYYAQHAADFLKDKALAAPHGKAYVQYEPLGVILAVMPWNFPFWQVFRFAAPHIVSGNTALLKHASNVPQCALAIADCFTKAGFPSGVFQTLLIPSSSVPAILADERVRGVSLTGSEEAGKSVAAEAARNLKKSVLELGGSDAFVVLDATNLGHVVQMAAKSRLVNMGQSCIAAKRFIVHESVYENFVSQLKGIFKSVRIQDPLQEGSTYGPMAQAHLAEELNQQVKQSVQMGAEQIGVGYLGEAIFQPSILLGVKEGMPAWEEELFGPVASVRSFSTVEEAIHLANDSRFGLGGSVWGQVEKAESVARQIHSGAVYVNQMMASHPAIPFGGVKHSGYGKELSESGLWEFTNAKSIWVA